MASIRPPRTSTSTARRATAQTPSDAVSAIARESARIQLAALSAVGEGLASWAQAADRLTRSVGDELLRRLDGETDARELIVAVAAATAVHLHDLAALPSVAVNHFDARVLRAPVNS
jgi:hypothetical protein